jgi:hypothetical protein
VFTKIDPESLDHLHSIALYNASDPKKVEQEIKKTSRVILMCIFIDYFPSVCKIIKAFTTIIFYLIALSSGVLHK